MDLIADLADRFSFGEVRITHEQNVALADVAAIRALRTVEQAARAAWRPNIGLLTDIICCPAAISSPRQRTLVPIAEAISAASTISTTCTTSANLDLNISGCMNSCGHHHIGPHRHSRRR